MATVVGKTSVRIDDLVNPTLVDVRITPARHLVTETMGGLTNDLGPLVRPEDITDLLGSELDQLQLDLHNLNVELDTLNDTTLPQLQVDLANANAELSELENTTIPELNNRLDDAEAEVINLNFTVIPNLNASLSTAQGQINTLNGTTIPNINAALTSNQSAITTLNNTTIPDLNTKINTLNNTTIPDLTNTLAAHTTSINTLNNTTIPGISSTLAGHTTSINTLNNTTIPGLNSQLDTLNNTTIPGLNTRLNTAESDIDGAQANVASLQGKFPIVGTDISDGAISTPKMTANTINGDRITANTLNASKIVAGSVTTDRMTANTIDGSVITANTLNAAKIIAGTITTDRMTANTINGDRVTANTLNADKIIAGTITTNLMSANTINGDRITANTLNADKIIANTITGDKIKANTISVANLLVGSMDNLIQDPTFQADVGVGWSATSGLSIAPTASRSGGRALQFANSATQQTTYNTPQNIPCEAGDVFNLSLWYEQVGAALPASGLMFGARFTLANGTTTFTSFYSPATAVDTWTRLQGQATAPANTVSVSFYVVSQTANSAGTLIVDYVSVVRAANGELIVDGSIYTNHMVANTISGDRITVNTLHGDKIIAATIIGDKIVANTIHTKLLAISDLTNFAPDYSIAANRNVFVGSNWIVEDMGTATNRWELTHTISGSPAGNDHLIASSMFEVLPGDQFYVSAEIQTDASVNYTTYLGLRTLNDTGGIVSYSNSTNGGASYSSAAADGVWTTIGADIIVPANATTANVEVLALVGGGTPKAGKVRVRNFTLRRKNEGKLIVDGEIITNHMTANTINGDRVTANTLNAAKIIAGTITTDRMTANTIDGDRITANTLNATKIVAGSITTDRMTANTINGDRITFNTMQGDRITVNTLSGDRIVANTIQGDRIVANTLNGNRIIANTINAGAINIGDFTNLVAPLSDWTGATLGYNTDTLGPYLISTGNTTGNTFFRYPWDIAVKPGDQFYFEWAVYANYAGYSGNAAVPYIQWLDATGATVLTSTSGPAIPQGTNTYLVSGTDLLAPAGAYFMRVIPYTTANGRAAIRNVSLRRKNTGSLIVDGAIDGMIITGATVRTASSGARLNFDSAGLKAYNASNAQTLDISSSSGTILVGPTTGTFPAQVSIGTFTNLVTGSGQGAVRLISGGTGWGSSDLQAYIEPNSGNGTMTSTWNSPYPNAVNGFSAYAKSARITLSTTFQGLSNLNIYSNTNSTISCESSYLEIKPTTLMAYATTKATLQGGSEAWVNAGTLITLTVGNAWLSMRNSGNFPLVGREGSSGNLQFMDNRIRVVNAAANAFANIEAAAFVVSSDQRSKENIKRAPQGAMERIKKVLAYDYTVKNGSGNKQRGLMAQEVQKVLPHAVSTDEEGKLALSLYDLLTEAYAGMQEMDKRIEALEASLN